MRSEYLLTVRVNERFLDKTVALMDEKGILEDASNLRNFSSQNNSWHEVELRLPYYAKDKVLNGLNKIPGIIYSCTNLPLRK